MWFIVASASAASVDEYNKKKNAETLNEFLPKRKSIKDLKDKNIYKLGKFVAINTASTDLSNYLHKCRARSLLVYCVCSSSVW